MRDKNDREIKIDDIPAVWVDTLGVRPNNDGGAPSEQPVQPKVSLAVLNNKTPMRGVEEVTALVSIHLGELKISLEDFISMGPGSEFSFPFNQGIAVEVCSGRTPVARGAISKSEEGLNLTIEEVYFFGDESERKLSIRAHETDSEFK